MDLDRIIEAWPRLPTHIRAAMAALLDVGHVIVDENGLTTQAAAKYLSMHPSTLANWRLSGVGPTYVSVAGDKNKRGKVRYRKVDLDGWLESRIRETA